VSTKITTKDEKRTVPTAVLTIRRAGQMTPERRRLIAGWLRYHARLLVLHGKEYSGVFTGRYMR